MEVIVCEKFPEKVCIILRDEGLTIDESPVGLFQVFGTCEILLDRKVLRKAKELLIGDTRFYLHCLKDWRSPGKNYPISYREALEITGLKKREE